MITDDKEKLAQQLDRTTGDKLSALEVTGQIGIGAAALSGGFSQVEAGERPVLSVAELRWEALSLPPLLLPEKAKDLSL